MRAIIPGVLILALTATTVVGAAERINQEGRILGAAPTVSTPTLFNTAAADAIVSAMQIFPVTSAWNEDISQRPLLGGSSDPTQSNAMIAQIRDDVYTGLAGHAYANRQRVVVFQEMNYVLIPDSQPSTTNIRFVTYPDDSDYNGGTNPIATWPIPSNMPIETWPSGTGSLTLLQWQQDINNDGGDRHSSVVQPGVGKIFETWQAILTGNTPAWEASNGCIFDLTSNTLRPAGETSGDAAGLPLFPALVRYDEAERGMVEHAMRIVVKRSRQTYLYPATHQAGSTAMTQVPAMGQRVRLKSSFAVPGSWSKEEKAIAYGLKKYGALVADNGGFFSISICPDDRWPAGCFDHLATGASSGFCDINNFEVVETTGATAGPRSAGAPTVNAGTDQSVAQAGGATLAGSATGSGITTSWYVYPYTTPPGTVTFGNAAALGTTASFSVTGTYTLMLKATDGVHAPAYDAVVITVIAGSPPTVATAASATPNPVTGTTTALSALGTDDGGEPALTYTWATTGTPPAAVAFSANGTNAAKNCTATFTQPGSYQFQVTIKDTTNLTAISTVTVAVNSTYSLRVSPIAASVATSATQQFTAGPVNQFGNPVAISIPVPTWSLTGAPTGTVIDANSGLLTAGTTIGGPFTVTATAGSLTGTAQASVVDATIPAITSPATASGAVGTAFTYTITATNSPSSYSASGLPPGLTRSGAVISGTPTKAGTYAVGVGATNAAGTGLKTVTVTIATAGGGGGGGSGSGGGCGGGLSAALTLLVGFALLRLTDVNRASRR